MAGSQDASENPVAINVVPMVDVIFCLCVFFMCSFKFKQIEGKFDTWLPKNEGPGDRLPPIQLPEMRVAILWDAATGTISRRFGTRTASDDAELGRLLREGRGARVASGAPEPPVTIDADRRVPWNEVVRVVDLAKQASFSRIEFALGAPVGEKR